MKPPAAGWTIPLSIWVMALIGAVIWAGAVWLVVAVL